jgi:hypothetical protein
MTARVGMLRLFHAAKEAMMRKEKSSRRHLIKLALSLMALLVLTMSAPTGGTTAQRGATARDSGDCMSQCHTNMSDCLGNGGGYSCIEEFYSCSGGCNQFMPMQ